MAEASETWDEYPEVSVTNLFKNISIHKTELQRSDGNSEGRGKSRREFVKLPCGHRRPAHYIIAWFKYCLKQRQTEFSCPAFDESRKRICGAKLSFEGVCGLIPLTSKQTQFFQENLSLVTAGHLCHYKACPGCLTYVERQDQTNLCVHCTICTATKKHTYYFCWSCRSEWKGPPTHNALRCSNNSCGQEVIREDPLVPCTPEFKEKKLREKGDDIYPVKERSSDRKRLALLINNVEFEYGDDRDGAEKDEMSMERLLKALGYTVLTLRDLTAQGMSAAMRDFSQREEHSRSDSCFVVLMSHGSASGICGVSSIVNSDGEEDIFSTDDIYNCLNTTNCPGLRDKPKVIFIQSCRGVSDPAAAGPSSWPGESSDSEVDVTVRQGGPARWFVPRAQNLVLHPCVDVQDSMPKTRENREKDFCCLRSYTRYTVSIRNPQRGSDFIQDIVEIFNKHAHEDHIEELFRKVLKKFKEHHPYQMPSKERTTLSKLFYLFPGL